MGNKSQGFRGEIALWVKLDHPNILRCSGVTPKPLQIVTEWMENGPVMEYVQNDKSADRISLVSKLPRFVVPWKRIFTTVYHAVG